MSYVMGKTSKRWKEYCGKLYAKRHNIMNSVFNHSETTTMEPEPLLSEVQNIIRKLKLGKSASTDAIMEGYAKHGVSGTHNSDTKINVQ